MIKAPGFYPNMDAEEYFADPCEWPSLRQSLIPTLVTRSPYHAAWMHPRTNPYGPPDQGDKARWLGSAVHRLALGRGRDISLIRYPDYTSSSAREARDLALANNRIPVLERDHVKALDMAKIVKDAIAEALGGAPYVTEVPFFWQEETQQGPIWAAGMLDVWCEARAKALDVKALRTAAIPEAFGRVAGENGYDVQNVFYERGLTKILPDLAGRITLEDLHVETLPPHGYRLFKLDAGSRQVINCDIQRAIELWGECLAKRNWPSYPKESAEVATPAFHQQRVMSREYAQES